MTDLIIARQKDVCLICGGDVFAARLKLADPGTGGREWQWVDGYECLCGRYLKDGNGNRRYVERLEDPGRNDTVRQIAELLHGTDSPQAALDRLLRSAAEGGQDHVLRRSWQ